MWKSLIHTIPKIYTASWTDFQSIPALLYLKRWFRYDTNMSDVKRILLKIGRNESNMELAHFTQCFMETLHPGGQDCTCYVHVQLESNHLHIRLPQAGDHAVKMKHPSFCPMHALTASIKEDLPREIYERGVDCGAAVILESGDNKVLLTRRADHLRTFPSIWVPPGGHIEMNETVRWIEDLLTGRRILCEAGLRELREETGLLIPDDLVAGSPAELAVWESVFPPKLSLGNPKRHHAVVYLYVKLKQHVSAESLMADVNVDPKEVGALAWFDRDKVTQIVAAQEGASGQKQGEQSTETFRSLIVDSAGKQVMTDLALGDLLKTAGDERDNHGRVSTGTKVALEEWLALTSGDKVS